LKNTLSSSAAASGSAILKIMKLLPMSYRVSKLIACFMLRFHDAAPNTLTGWIVDLKLFYVIQTCPLIAFI